MFPQICHNYQREPIAPMSAAATTVSQVFCNHLLCGGKAGTKKDCVADRSMGISKAPGRSASHSIALNIHSGRELGAPGWGCSPNCGIFAE